LQWASHYWLELTGREESIDSVCEVAENAVFRAVVPTRQLVDTEAGQRAFIHSDGELRQEHNEASLACPSARSFRVILGRFA
jgi:hypothetical protein